MRKLLINVTGVNSEGGLVVFEDILHSILPLAGCSVSVLIDSARQESIANEQGLSESQIFWTSLPRWLHPSMHFFGRYRKIAAQFDLILHLGNFAPRFKGKNVVFIQNLLPFEARSVRQIAGAYRFKDRILKRLIERSLQNSDLIVVQAAHVRRVLQPLTDKPVLVIRPDLPMGQISRKADAKGVMTITNAIPYKQAAFACAVLSEVKRRKPDCRMTVVGLDWSERFPELCFIEKLARAEMLELMAEHAALFHASLVETLGLPIIEAQKMGLDALVPDLGYAHSVCNGRTVFFDPRSPNDARAKVLGFLNGELIPASVEPEQVDTNYLSNWPELISSC